MPNLVLTLHTARHTYAVIHRSEVELRFIVGASSLGTTDSRNRPLISADLGRLLDEQDISDQGRRYAFIIPLRRRSVALLCDAVSEMHTVAERELAPLPPLLDHRLPHRWVSGVYTPNETLVLVLDLYEIALDLIRQTAQPHGETA